MQTLRRRILKKKGAIENYPYNTILVFSTPGSSTWTVPAGVTLVEVFLVGGGGGGDSGPGGGSGYTKTFRGSGHLYHNVWVQTGETGRDGNAITVTPGQAISIIVGAGASGKYESSSAPSGGYSQFMSASYRAYGGESGYKYDSSHYYGGDGGSGGGGYTADSYAGSDGSSGAGDLGGSGQGHTTRNFGEKYASVNAGGGGTSHSGSDNRNGGSGQTEGKGEDGNGRNAGSGGGGYGGGGGGGWGTYQYGGAGGSGVVIIRYLDASKL